ncbi:MAG: hypothetical protein LBB83_08680 [Treponema sp.]|jgi:hypothetical protein|nr:hypothetical protein [Treponema sp.]
MEHGNLHSLVPLADFKAVLGIDDRDDALSRYCLITAAYAIEQYCKRQFCNRSQLLGWIYEIREWPHAKICG